MTDFINKLILLCLAFIILIIGPLVNISIIQQGNNQRLIFNEATEFLEKTADKSYVTKEDLDEIYLKLNSHGIALDVTVTRYIYAPTTNAEGSIIPNYVNTDDFSTMGTGAGAQVKFNDRDLVKIHISEIGVSSYRRLIYTVLHSDSGKFDFELAKSIQ